MMDRLTSSIKKRAFMEWSRGNPVLAGLLFLFLGVVIIAIGLSVDRAQSIANNALDKSVSPITEAFVDAWNWGLTPILIALALYVLAVIAIGQISARLNRPLIVETPDECELEHVTAEQRQLLNWANNQQQHDMERTKEYLKIDVTVDLLSIYSLSDPIVTIHFDILSSVIHRVIVGDEVKGHIKSFHILGDVPRVRLDGNGSKEVLSLTRGETGRLTLEQHISTDLRNNWIKNHLEKEIPLYLKNLFVSVQLVNPNIAGIVHQDNLEYQANVSAALPRIMEWDGSELKKIVDAQP